LHKRLIPLLAPCFSLLSFFFSLFRGSSGLENPPKTVCFQLVGQKSPPRAEQEANREIIRGYQVGNRAITGAEQAGRDSTGSSAVRRHSVTIEPLEMWRLNPTLLDRRTASGRIPPVGGSNLRGGTTRAVENAVIAENPRLGIARSPQPAKGD
jgi:hypothetical protein